MGLARLPAPTSAPAVVSGGNLFAVTLLLPSTIQLQRELAPVPILLGIPMNHKLIMAVALFAAIPMMAYAQQDDLAAKTPKSTVEDAQKIVQTISSDPAKLKAYCEMGKLQEQMEQAE